MAAHQCSPTVLKGLKDRNETLKAENQALQAENRRLKLEYRRELLKVSEMMFRREQERPASSGSDSDDRRVNAPSTSCHGRASTSKNATCNCNDHGGPSGSGK